MGLHFLPPQLDLYNYDGSWDALEFHPFWDGVTEMGIPVFFSLKPRRSPESESYAAELETIIRWDEKVSGRSGGDDSWPTVADVHDRGLTGASRRGVRPVRPTRTCTYNSCSSIALGAEWDYPMSQANTAIEKCARVIGAERLMWGTDMPIVTRFWTYRQCIDQIRKNSRFPVRTGSGT